VKVEPGKDTLDRDTGVSPVHVVWDLRHIGFPTFQPSARAGRPCHVQESRIPHVNGTHSRINI